MAVMAMALLAACSDSSVGPGPDPALAKLAGDWEAISFVVGDEQRMLQENNVFWYFTATGEYCTLWGTPYGAYNPGQAGRVSSPDLVLAECFEGACAEWRLVLSTGADSLRAELLAPDTLAVDAWRLVRVADAPEATCFSDGTP